MRLFSAVRLDDRSELRFLGIAWGDGGVHCCPDGIHWWDCEGRPLTNRHVRELRIQDGDLLRSAYCGDEIPDRAGFVSWMCANGIPESLATLVADDQCQPADSSESAESTAGLQNQSAQSAECPSSRSSGS